MILDTPRDERSLWLAELKKGNRPSDDHSLDRFPNNKGDYEPGNCRWATQKEQMRNQSRNRLLTFLGQTKTLVEWCETLKLPYHTIKRRVAKGWEADRALTEPVQARRNR